MFMQVQCFGSDKALVFWGIQNEDVNLQVIDHAEWQIFLDKYLVLAADGVNRVNYSGVAVADRVRLEEYIAALIIIDPRSYSKLEQLAYWINLYNALTVNLVLKHDVKTSILDIGGRFFSRGPWKIKITSVVGYTLTLDDIEHRILRPLWKDHRVHYGLNCASYSCPNLLPQAYTASNIDELLTANEMAYINHPRGVRFDDDGTLVLSSIYDWYADDFAGRRQDLLGYLGKHHKALSGRISSYLGPIRYDYKWALNGI